MECRKKDCKKEATHNLETPFGWMVYCTRHANEKRNSLCVRTVTKLPTPKGGQK